MQEWTLDRTSESPESSGRPSALSREAKLFRPERRSTRRSTRAERGRTSQEALQAELHTTPQRHDRDDEEEDQEGRRSGPRRLSRHIPQRVGTDMTVSSFNLLTATTCGARSSTASPHSTGGGGAGVRDHRRNQNGHVGRNGTPGAVAGAPAAASAGTNVHGGAASGPTPSSSVLTSFSESMVSDDSSYMTSLYTDVLAGHLIGHHSGASAAAHCTGAEGAAAHVFPRVLATPGLSRSVCDSSPTLSNERVADGRASNESGGGRGGSTDTPISSARRGLGGEVLRFADTASSGGPPQSCRVASHADTSALRLATFPAKGTARTVATATSAASAVAAAALPRVRARTIYTSGSGSRSAAPTRVFNTTPERVLDAPQFPTEATQLLDWGVNNCIAIGMGSSLYSWNGDSGEATKVVDLDTAVRLRCVQWLHKCSCVAMSVQEGTTAIFDCRTSNFLRTVRLPSGLEVTGLSVKGPVLAVASSGPHGTTCTYDLRAKEALVATYEGHTGAITSLHYSPAEPFYLATGGSDGAVRIWDARRATAPRYAFNGVHHGAINAVRWDPHKRSRLFTGGEDGVMSLIDTHAPKRTIEMDSMADEEGVAVGYPHEHLAQYITRAVNTQYPIVDLVCHGTHGEVLTAHKSKGQLQLRKAATFQLLATFTAPHCDAALSSLTMAPDQERVCAAQGDETLKFWRVFHMGDTSERGGAGRHGGPRWTPPHHDTADFSEDSLR